MVEIKIQCPKCKYQLNVQGKPQEKISITCPKYTTPGTFTFPDVTSQVGYENVLIWHHRWYHGVSKKNLLT